MACLVQAKAENLPWNLYIKAQAMHFGFNFCLKLRLNATPELLPNLKSHRFSLLFKLRRWRLRIQSDCGSPVTRTASIRSKLVRIFQKLRIKGRTAPIAKSAKFHVDKKRLLKCGGFSIVAAGIALVVSAFGFDATKFLQYAMEYFP